MLSALLRLQNDRQLVGHSPSFCAEIEKIPLVADSDASVLISGETGTGKELCARAIHSLSLRAQKPFIAVNCAAIPPSLMETELFGHKRGAFTSASTSRTGLIHEACGGTLFLDEVVALSAASQDKLLRFLQEKQYRPLGASRTYQVDVRIISASNVTPEQAVREGRMNPNFYYRLNVIPIRLPPLRDRREDIPLLARHFLAKYSAELKKQAKDFSPGAIEQLVVYDWPGNVRELENAVQRTVLLSSNMLIQRVDVLSAHPETASAQKSFKEAKARTIAQFERNYITKLLMNHQGNVSQAARAAQKNRRAFSELIRKHRIDVQRLRRSHPF